MTRLAYTYSVVRYIHDPAAGEMLNIGVLLYASSGSYFGYRLEPRFKRLSEAFSSFDGDQYRRALRQFEQAITRLWDNLTAGLPGMFDLPTDLGALASQVWPDVDLSFRFGPTLAGVSDDAEQALESLFQRMVIDQYERPVAENRSDEDIWVSYSHRLPTEVKRVLREKTLETEDYELKFPHAFKNGLWHLLQPVTLDYSQSGNIQDKAARWLGRATLLRDNPEVARLYLLLGAPHQEGHQRAYLRAKNILHKLPVEHRIIEEDEAADFARYLLDYMKSHGVISEPNVDAAITDPHTMGRSG